MFTVCTELCRDQSESFDHALHHCITFPWWPRPFARSAAKFDHVHARAALALRLPLIVVVVFGTLVERVASISVHLPTRTVVPESAIIF